MDNSIIRTLVESQDCFNRTVMQGWNGWIMRGETMNLIEAFSGIEDDRRAEGKRYPLIPLLIITMMSILCG